MRDVLPFNPTWNDKEFQKSFKRLDKGQQTKRTAELADLITDLKNAGKSIAICPTMKGWQPSSYCVPGLSDLFIIELRGRFPLRVIIRHVTDDARDVVLLLGATLTHDHERLIKILCRNAAEIKDWTAPPAEPTDDNTPAHANAPAHVTDRNSAPNPPN